MALRRFRKALRERLEISYEPSFKEEHAQSLFFDVQDQDILGYVQEFLHGLTPKSIFTFGAVATKEEALNALNWVEQFKPSNSAHAKTARALRELITSQAEELVAAQH